MLHTKPAMMEKEKILVLWNISSCPIPSGCHAREVSSRIDSALKKAGYSGPLTITFIGDMREAPEHKVLADLASTGITLIHNQDTEIQTELFKWTRRNPPPANIMLMSGPRHLEYIARTLYCLDWDGYDILLANPDQEGQVSELMVKSFLSVVRRKWFLPDFLDSGPPYQTRVLPHTGLPQLSCSLCQNFAAQTFEEFTTHINHMNEDESMDEQDEDESMDKDEDEGKYDMMHTEAAMMEKEEKILVWWNISSCPIPSGYDAREVVSRIDSALKKAGYSGPLTITAIGDIAQAPNDKVWEELSSTGITLIHAQDTEIQRELFKWIQKNPPPAKIMLISGPRQLQCLAPAVFGLDWEGYEIILAYPPRRDQVPEWVWESFLSVVSEEWLWTGFLDSGSACQKRKKPLHQSWSCALCNFVARRFKEFTPHLKSEQHQLMASIKDTTEEMSKKRKTEEVP